MKKQSDFFWIDIKCLAMLVIPATISVFVSMFFDPLGTKQWRSQRPARTLTRTVRNPNRKSQKDLVLR
jgi:hypothetical protein